MPIRSTVTRIGQGPQNDVVLDDDTVSTNHARLEFADGNWRLTDLESRNGTYVDGVKLAPGVPTPITPPARVGFGATKLVFQDVEGADPTAVEPPPPPVSATAARAPGIRIPVWLLLLVLLFVAGLIFLYITFGGGPVSEPVPPVPAPAAQLIHPGLAA